MVGSAVISRNNVFADGTGMPMCDLASNVETNLAAKNNYWDAASGPGDSGRRRLQRAGDYDRETLCDQAVDV
jgi:hypothetical protein